MNENHVTPTAELEDFYEGNPAFKFLQSYADDEYPTDSERLTFLAQYKHLIDKNTFNEANDVVTCVYWFWRDLTVSQIADALGLSRAGDVIKFVRFKPIYFPTVCLECAEDMDIVVANRSELDALTVKRGMFLERLEEGIYSGDEIVRFCLCEKCQISYKNERKQGWNKPRQIIPSKVEQRHRVNYHEYLLSAEWQALRLIAIENAKGRCQLCYTPNNLHVHHRTYERLGHEDLSDLTVLCATCHAKFHDKLGGE